MKKIENIHKGIERDSDLKRLREMHSTEIAKLQEKCEHRGAIEVKLCRNCGKELSRRDVKCGEEKIILPKQS